MLIWNIDTCNIDATFQSRYLSYCMIYYFKIHFVNVALRYETDTIRVVRICKKSLCISRVALHPYAYKTAECDGGIENRALVISSTCGVEYKGGFCLCLLVMHRFRRSDNKARVKHAPRIKYILSIGNIGVSTNWDETLFIFKAIVIRKGVVPKYYHRLCS